MLLHFRFRSLVSCCTPCGKQHLRDIATPDWVRTLRRFDHTHQYATFVNWPTQSGVAISRKRCFPRGLHCDRHIDMLSSSYCEFDRHIDILWVRQTHRHLVSSTCYHHLVSSTDTSTSCEFDMLSSSCEFDMLSSSCEFDSSTTCNYKSAMCILPLMSNIAHFVVACSPGWVDCFENTLWNSRRQLVPFFSTISPIGASISTKVSTTNQHWVVCRNIRDNG